MSLWSRELGHKSIVLVLWEQDAVEENTCNISERNEYNVMYMVCELILLGMDVVRKSWLKNLIDISAMVNKTTDLTHNKKVQT